jgi:hypothetical protein
MDSGEVVSLMRWPLFNPQEDFWYSYLLEAEAEAIMRLEGLGQLKGTEPATFGLVA